MREKQVFTAKNANKFDFYRQILVYFENLEYRNFDRYPERGPFEIPSALLCE